jgi:hypothetical protein
LQIAEGVGSTLTGDQGPAARWRIAYALTNPTDTDRGLHPQNTFRLVTKSSWDNAGVEAAFRIRGDQLSASPNRNESNGLLLMTRYQDQNTLYYAGLRVDGTAVIKKKYRGVYHTMAQEAVFPGRYHRTENPNLLPKDRWISLRTETVTEPDGSIALRLFMHDEGTRSWMFLLEARDDGRFGSTSPITLTGHAGIRTDFMDVEFDSFRVDQLPQAGQ